MGMNLFSKYINKAINLTVTSEMSKIFSIRMESLVEIKALALAYEMLFKR